MQGTITEIQRFSVHDGPGIRTTVFFKGCNLRCFWCHNPETHRPEPELQLQLERCIACGACFAVCETGAHQMVDGERVFERAKCVACGRCAQECYAEALTLVGRRVDVAEVMREVLADRPFYANSGGGVTLSGGEPLLQPAFCEALLTACRKEGIHTAVETAANVPWERIKALLPLLDLVMLDIKVLDETLHREATGVGNERILANVERLGTTDKPLIVRTPVIPGVNDTQDAIAAIARFASRLPNLVYYELLPFHPMAASKYDSLGREYAARTLARPTPETIETLAEGARLSGIAVRSGHS
jgi:pyruvate formate lyase activating enzyme